MPDLPEHAADAHDATVHRRSIEIDVADSDGGLRVTGRLRDERPWHPDPIHQVLHDISIELVVELRTMTITSASSTMAAFPHAECPLVTARFGDLAGVSVARGYSRALREVFGGVTGCAHVYELARCAGAAIVQASMSRYARRRASAPDPERVKAALAGTCHVWSADGVGMAKLDLGWKPGEEEYPAPPLAEIIGRRRDA